jgi:hypothetical protein
MYSSNATVVTLVLQGDMEREKGLEISILMDRSKPGYAA